MLVQRDLLGTIGPFLPREEYLAVVGPRQSGKTTLLTLLQQHLVEEHGVSPDSIQVVTFEDRRLLRQFEEDPTGFVRSYREIADGPRLYLMMDEFQYATDGGQKLKLAYDSLEDVKIIVTGSSSLDIKAHVSRFMVGRMLSFQLLPFNFGETLRSRDKRLHGLYARHSGNLRNYVFNGALAEMDAGPDPYREELTTAFENYCIWGGYPAVVLAPTALEKHKLLRDIYNAYVLKDIKTLLELATEDELFRLSQFLSTRIGNRVVYQNLCNASGLNHRQMKKHLKILEETFVCRLLKPFFRNKQKELSKNPKAYFLDLGFRNSLMENMRGLDQRSDAGAVVENAVFVRLHELCRERGGLHFWRKKTGTEVDFVIRSGAGPIPIEVKYRSYDAEQVPRGLRSFIRRFGPDRAVVLTKDFWGQARCEETSVLFAPVYYV